MKATVREYTVKKKVVVLEIDEAEAAAMIDPTGPTVDRIGKDVVHAIVYALERDRASDAKEDEDVPF